ncbi:hypothetical protein ACFQRB_17615 [Halobaculum litoreum]|uniref:Uncharacterized protein n=1 Tax=Halobaculum litoreum TaxID=3031998 RepID=A0ABD5XRS6_9EURY
MSAVASERFDTGELAIDGIESGTSVLLTGDDPDALAEAFYRLVAPAPEEEAAVIATDTQGRTIKRELNRVESGAGDRTSVLAGTGRESAGVQCVDDIGELTGLGMTFSSMITEAQRGSGRFRSGIMLCSSVCVEADDIRSVYRMLNSNFLPGSVVATGSACARSTRVSTSGRRVRASSRG